MKTTMSCLHPSTCYSKLVSRTKDAGNTANCRALRIFIDVKRKFAVMPVTMIRFQVIRMLTSSMITR